MKIGLTLCIIASVCMAIMVQASSNAAQLQSMRTSVYAAIVARSGEKSDCGTFVAMFSPDGVIRSPVGATPAVGTAAITAHCNAWNKALGPAGNGWYPKDLWSGGNQVATELRIRAQGTGGCTVSLEGILVFTFNTSTGLIQQWDHYYDAEWNQPQWTAKC